MYDGAPYNCLRNIVYCVSIVNEGGWS